MTSQMDVRLQLAGHGISFPEHLDFFEPC